MKSTEKHIIHLFPGIILVQGYIIEDGIAKNIALLITDRAYMHDAFVFVFTVRRADGFLSGKKNAVLHSE